MNQPFFTRAAIVGLFVLAVIYVVVNFSHWEVGVQIVWVLGLSVAGGVIFVLYILPTIGDFIGGSVYSGGEKLRMDPSMKAAAKVSAGDYDGAVTEYLKLAAANPGDSFPVVEAAKVALEKLSDPERAITILTEALAAAGQLEEPMDQDSHASLHFRLAEIYVERLDDHEAGLDVLRTVTETFEGTRHAANAAHKIQQWEEAQFAEGQQ